MRPKLVKVFSLVAVSLLVISCDSTRTSGPPSNAVVVNVTANTSLSVWLQSAVAQFNQSSARTSSGKPVYVELASVEAGQAILDMTSSGTLPALWIPDNEVWTNVLAKRGLASFEGNCQDVAHSPLVIVMWRPIAEALGWPGRSLGWLDLGSLAADPSSWAYYSGGQFGSTFRVSHTHPGLSGSGISTLLAVVQAARAISEAVTVGDIQQPIVQASVTSFEGTVVSFNSSTDKLGQTMRDRGINYLSAVVAYENTVITYGGGDPNMVAIYPYEGTFMATHPACVNSAADATTQEGAKLFRDYLIKPEAQKLAVANGLRPVNSAVPITAPLDSVHGVDVSQPKIIFNSPTVDTIAAIGELWQSAREDINLVMLLDTSGSMAGDKIDSLRTAATQFIQQMGDKDYLTLIVFSTRPETVIDHQRVGTARQDAINQIAAMEAGGNTALYDAIGLAATHIKKTNSSQTSNVMIVLTDGQDTDSSSYTLDQAVAAAPGNNTTVFAIAYGSDADKDVLSQVTNAAKGNLYLGTEANIASIYQEMSAVFGGTAGIGR